MLDRNRVVGEIVDIRVVGTVAGWGQVLKIDTNIASNEGLYLGGSVKQKGPASIKSNTAKERFVFAVVRIYFLSIFQGL